MNFSQLPNTKTALTYGLSIMCLTIPKGTNAFYVSAWEYLNPDVPSDEEKEVCPFGSRK